MRGGKRVNAGKKKGSRHRKTIEWEEFGKELLNHGLPKALTILKKSDDEKFMAHFTKLLEYFQPKATQHIDLNARHDFADLGKLLELPLNKRLEMWRKVKIKHDEKHG